MKLCAVLTPTESNSVFFRDLLVACVAGGLGLSMIQVALVNRGWWFENFIIRQIESSRGRPAARKALGIGGGAMIILGAWTMLAPWIRSNDRNEAGFLNRPVDFEVRTIQPG